MTSPLLELAHWLKRSGYEFVTVTPSTHRLNNARPGNERATSLRDVFGWSRAFSPELLPARVFALMREAEACVEIPQTSLWQPLIRFSSLSGELFAHSAFPTSERDAVFFGPDSYRFARAIEEYAPPSKRAVDIGCGSGVGGIVLAKLGLASSVVLSDINTAALRCAELNARLAGVSAEIAESNVLNGVVGEFDLVIANPPYLSDEAGRVYRDGGGNYGEQLSARIVRESLTRLRQTPSGGCLLLYTGAAIVNGSDTFRRSISRELHDLELRYDYRELDPDVFSDELERPAYSDVERIAAVLLKVQVGDARARTT